MVTKPTPGTHEVSGEGVSDAMRRKRNADTTALSPGTNAFVNSAARERSTEAGTEEGSVVERGTTGLDIGAQHLGQFRVERESAFVTTLTLHGNGQLLEVDAGVAKRRTLGGADAGAIEKREQCAIAQTEDGVGSGLG